MTIMRLQPANNDTDEDEGLSDAGIETFKGAPFSSVARETGQNSRDAARAFPVRVEFDVIDIPLKSFPDASSFSATIEACKQRANERKDQKEQQFFSKAEKLLQKDVFHGLRISDEGTTGLLGPCTPGHPFHSLVKASGVSNKNDPTSGGSYGIGKRAAFAVSDLHTVFYSTLYEEGDGTRTYLAQGKYTLVSHELNGKKFKATGYWGKPNYLPVTDESDAPKWLHRDSIGTTTVSVGFSPARDWRFRIAESLVRNFFVAIHREELEFHVDNRSISINKETLHQTLVMADIEQAAEAQGTLEDLQFSQQLYECLLDSETKIFSTSIPNLGAVHLHLLIREGLPRRVAIIRNGMVITDSLQHFGDKLTNFPMYKEFVALVEPVDVQSKTMFKRLENPQHNELSVDRLIDEAEQTTVRRSMLALKKWIRESIRSEALVTPVEETTIDEMNEFFGDVSNADRIPTGDDGDTSPIAVTYSPIKSRHQPPNDGGIGDEDEGGSGERTTSEGGSAPGDGQGTGPGTGGTGGGEPLAIQDFRNVPDPADPGRNRFLFFTPLNSGSAKLRVFAKGMNNDVELAGFTLKDHKGVPAHRLKLSAGVRTKVHLQLAAAYQGPIGIRAIMIGGEDEAA